MELTNINDEEVLQISALKKWRKRFLQGRTELGDEPRSEGLVISDLTQAIAELIRTRPSLSCKMLCRHPRVSKEICLRILQEKLGLKRCCLRWISHEFIPNMKA
jgi:hypothetical protein